MLKIEGGWGKPDATVRVGQIVTDLRDEIKSAFQTADKNIVTPATGRRRISIASYHPRLDMLDFTFENWCVWNGSGTRLNYYKRRTLGRTVCFTKPVRKRENGTWTFVYERDLRAAHDSTAKLADVSVLHCYRTNFRRSAAA